MALLPFLEFFGGFPRHIEELIMIALCSQGQVQSFQDRFRKEGTTVTPTDTTSKKDLSISVNAAAPKIEQCVLTTNR